MKTCWLQATDSMVPGLTRLTQYAFERCRLLSLGWPIVVEVSEKVQEVLLVLSVALEPRPCAVPSCELQEVITFGSTVIAIGIVGRLGPLQLSIFSLARSVTNITGEGPLQGLGFAQSERNKLLPWLILVSKQT